MTPSIDKTLHQFANLLPKLTDRQRPDIALVGRLFQYDVTVRWPVKWLRNCVVTKEWRQKTTWKATCHEFGERSIVFITDFDHITLYFTLLPNFGGFHRTLQRVRLANRGRLLLRTPGPVPFGTCICSNVETILSWTCHVYGPFEFRISLGTFILLNPIISELSEKLTKIETSSVIFLTTIDRIATKVFMTNKKINTVFILLAL